MAASAAELRERRPEDFVFGGGLPGTAVIGIVPRNHPVHIAAPTGCSASNIYKVSMSLEGRTAA